MNKLASLLAHIFFGMSATSYNFKRSKGSSLLVTILGDYRDGTHPYMSVDVMVVVVKIVIILLCLTLMIRQNIKYIQRASFTYMVHFYFYILLITTVGVNKLVLIQCFRNPSVVHSVTLSLVILLFAAAAEIFTIQRQRRCHLVAITIIVCIYTMIPHERSHPCDLIRFFCLGNELSPVVILQPGKLHCISVSAQYERQF